MPLSSREKLFGRICGAALTILGGVLIYASYMAMVSIGEYWKFFMAFGVILAAMGLPILLLRLK